MNRGKHYLCNEAKLKEENMKTLVIILIVLTGVLILVGILVAVIYYKVRKAGGIYFRAAGYVDNPHPLSIDNLIFVTGNSMRAIEDKNRDFMLRIDDLRKQLDAWKEEIEKEEAREIGEETQTASDEESGIPEMRELKNKLPLQDLEQVGMQGTKSSTGIRELRKLQYICDVLRQIDKQYEEVSYNASSELGHIMKTAKELKERSEKLRELRKKQRAKEKKK